MGRNIMISGIGKRNYLLALVAREGAVHGAAVVGADAAPLPPARPAVSRFEQLPPASSADFGDRYAEALARNDVSAFLTLIDPEIPVLGRLAADGLLGAARFVQPDAASSLICADKLRFHQVLSAHGVRTVPTASSPLDVFPFIRKHRFGSAASGFRVLERPEDLDAVDLSGEQEAAWVYQPFCSGQHYCVDAYFSLADNTLVDLCVKKVVNKSDGESYLLRSCSPDGFIEIVRRVSEVVRMRGIVNLDIYDIDGQLAVMEVNARIGGNYPASHILGVNLLRHVFAEGFDHTVPDPHFTPYEEGILVSKFIGFSDPFQE